MNAREPISEERLDAIRQLHLGVILPQVDRLNPATRRQAEHWLRQLAPVLTELLDEIEALDEELHLTDEELDRANRRLKLLRPRVRPSEAVVSAVHRERLDERRWRVRWREDGKRRTATFRSPGYARDAYEYLRGLQYQGRAW